jgi:DNA-binding MarR family transcriptional regulator
MQLALELERSPKRFGTDELLTHSEIHLIEIIGDNRGISVTDIGRALNVTKGAVSQGLKKLEKRGYTTKEPDPDNLSRAIVTLTQKGTTAFEAHREWHEKMDGGFHRYLQQLDENELRIITKFLERTEDFLGRRVQSSE